MQSWRLIQGVGGKRVCSFGRINFGAFLECESEIRKQFAIVENLEVVLRKITYDVTLGIADDDRYKYGIYADSDGGCVLSILGAQANGRGWQNAKKSQREQP